MDETGSYRAVLAAAGTHHRREHDAAAVLPMEKLLLKPAEVGAVLGIGRTKVFELIASGELESVLIGKCRRVPRVAVESFAERLRNEAGRPMVRLADGGRG